MEAERQYIWESHSRAEPGIVGKLSYHLVGLHLLYAISPQGWNCQSIAYASYRQIDYTSTLSMLQFDGEGWLAHVQHILMYHQNN